jgi:hypothetical protein
MFTSEQKHVMFINFTVYMPVRHDNMHPIGTYLISVLIEIIKFTEGLHHIY